MSQNDVKDIQSEADIYKIVDGTTESQARDSLGKSRREMTGVLAQNSRVKFLTISSKFMKPISVMNSALGLTISILLITEDVFWSLTFYIAFVIGLMVGGFFELWSTNSEHVFATKGELELGGEDRVAYKTILLSIKTYAVIMVLISAWNLPDYIIIQKTKNVDDNAYVDTRLKQIERLKKDKDNSKDSAVTTGIYQSKITRLNSEIEKIREEITKDLKTNSTSMYVKKREDAKTMIDSINKRIDKKNQEIAQAEKDMLSTASAKTSKQLYEDEISKKEDEIEKERERLKKIAGNSTSSTMGITVMLGILFVFLELGGTMASILSQRTILNSISQEEAYKENVTNTLFSSNIALKERNTRLKATKIGSDLEQNKTMTAVIAYESETMAQQHELTEKSRLAEIDRENARLLTESKMQELESHQMLALADGVAKKMQGLDTVRVKIGKML
ncbi:MAG: Unknown protein [uncultured Sulfurovum sp.]|uniref:Uncharacterized protein n=1 Tax=uncultured Sulfurovum sp. TaxID=269237 RepID=A0A6S6S9C1_9BACT|nr:MAG: Unknown protein [uncultured Sulfurovum sp.]